MTDIFIKSGDSVESVVVRFNHKFGKCDSPRSGRRRYGGYGSEILYFDEQKKFPFIIGYEVGEGKHFTRCFVELLPPAEDNDIYRIELTAKFAIWIVDPVNSSLLPGDEYYLSEFGIPCNITTDHCYGTDKKRFATEFGDKLKVKLRSVQSFEIFYLMSNVRMRKVNKKLEMLQWKNVEKLAKEFEVQKFLDFEIKADDQSFNASKYILGAHSDVFAAMLEIDMTESKTNRMTITDFSAQTVKDMLKYLHSGGLVFPTEGIDELSHIADKYNISTLMERCILALTSQD